MSLWSAAAAASPAGAWKADVVERDVEVKTPDGVADAALFHPGGKGRWAAALVWADALSLRQAFRLMGRRLAAAGYVVLIPNIYYRAKRAPVVGDDFDFGKPGAMASLAPLAAGLNIPGAIDRDAAAYLAFLDAQPQTDRARPAGVQGYCMGGRLALRTASEHPSRIGAAASFHGGGLVSDAPGSSHRAFPRLRAELLIAVAQDDDAREPTAKDTLRAAMASAGTRGVVEVYPADHGWCVPGSDAYAEAAAEKAWVALIDLYRRRLG